MNPNVFIPGPGAYDANLDPLQKKSPIYSMSARYGLPSDNHLKPGPGAHCPEKVRGRVCIFFVNNKLIAVITFQVNLSHVPSYSFGIKHSRYLGNFMELRTCR